ncbi:MAG: MBL fold metallo-hydrolase [Spirochaetota bacterium]|nr:MBL fold metallo-hydrolase [Spirochaetota bacterium]
MIIDHLKVGFFQENCYILYKNEDLSESQKALVVDPGDEGDRIADYLVKNNLELDRILLTHGHIDHVSALEYLAGISDSDVLLHEDDLWLYNGIEKQADFFGMPAVKLPAISQSLKHGDEIYFSNSLIKVIHTPGHTPGSVCYHFPDEKILLTGDTLFHGSVGRSDFPGGDGQSLGQSIRERLLVLDDAVRIYPGHMGDSTIGTEKKSNPFVNML